MLTSLRRILHIFDPAVRRSSRDSLGHHMLIKRGQILTALNERDDNEVSLREVPVITPLTS